MTKDWNDPRSSLVRERRRRGNEKRDNNWTEEMEHFALVPYVPRPTCSSPSRRPSTPNPSLIADIIPQILSYCDPQTLTSCSLVSRSFHSMANSNTLWDWLCKEHFGVTASELRPPPDPTRLLYVMHVRRLKELRSGMRMVGGMGVGGVGGGVPVIRGFRTQRVNF